MGKRSRFLNLSYLINTIIIKAKALELKIKRGSYPFNFFKDKIIHPFDYKYQLDFQNEYHALSYFNFEKAQEVHSENSSITQELIIALAYHNECIKNKELDKEYLIDLAFEVHKKASISESNMIFYIEEPYSRFDLRGRYFSGIVQGKAASLFLRCYLLTKDEKYKMWAKKCLLSCWRSIEDGGVLVSLPNNNIWVEEYPSPKPSMVLNGFLFYIIGLAEYLALEDNVEMKQKLETSLQSAMAWIPNYRLKKGLLYSMYRWNLCNVHYTGIMKYQFDHLYKLTNIPLFKDYTAFANALTDWETFDKII